MVKPMVLITGQDYELLEKQIAKFPVIRLYNPDYRKDEMFDSVIRGLKYADGLCDRVLILPAKYPMLLSDTIEKMMSCGHDNVVPVFGGRRGHLNPDWWSDTMTQYGELQTIRINEKGCFDDLRKSSDETLNTLKIADGYYISF